MDLQHATISRYDLGPSWENPELLMAFTGRLISSPAFAMANFRYRWLAVSSVLICEPFLSAEEARSRCPGKLVLERGPVGARVVFCVCIGRQLLPY